MAPIILPKTIEATNTNTHTQTNTHKILPIYRPIFIYFVLNEIKYGLWVEQFPIAINK